MDIKPIEVLQDKVRIRPKLIKKMRLLMWLGLIGGPIVFGVGLYQFLEMKSLKVKGITVQADVRDCSILNTGEGRHVYKVTADYQPAEYPIHRKEFIVQKNEYEEAQASRKIAVMFLPEDPSVSAAGTVIHPDTEPMIIGAGVFSVALAILLYFKKKKKDLKNAIYEELRPKNPIY